jgi:hypothetical protein
MIRYPWEKSSDNLITTISCGCIHSMTSFWMMGYSSYQGLVANILGLIYNLML